MTEPFGHCCDGFQIRGTGLILATEFTENKSAHEPFPPEWGKLFEDSVKAFYLHMLKDGLSTFFHFLCLQVLANTLQPNARSMG